MSSNPQWKSFQPPIMNSDTSILDFTKSLTIQNNMSPSSNFRNPSNGSGYNSSSNHFHSVPNMKDMSNNVFSSSSGGNYSSNFNSYSTNNSRFPPIGTFTGAESGDMYNGETISSSPVVNSPFNTSSTNNTNSSYNDSNVSNQGTRETGIIEKLLVST